MKRFISLAVLVALSAIVAAAGSRAASTLCVGGSGCYPTLAGALAAAQDGDTIHLNPGTFAGGVTITKSITLAGAGAQRTTISGGGPVLTIGTMFGETEPTVSIDGVTISGGVTTSSPESEPFTGGEGVMAFGGGIDALPNADFSGGANLKITNSVVTGNRATPTDTRPFGPPCPGDEPCPFALGTGGGINAWGALTLVNTTVSNNVAGGSVASDAEGAGINSPIGPVTIVNSTIKGNRAQAAAPDGRFADSGGIFAQGGAFSMTGSNVSNNSATLNAGFPDSVDMLSIAGGVHLGGGVTSATVTNTTVTGNDATMTNYAGYANAFSGGLHTDGVFTLTNDVISGNTVHSHAEGAEGDAFGDSGAGEMAGTLTNVQLTGNSVDVSSAGGNVVIGAGATIITGRITNGVISGNRLTASAPTGSVTANGAGLQTGGPLKLQGTSVTQNSLSATGASGTARGGGVFAVDLSPDGPPGGLLELSNSSVSHNSIAASAGITRLGGGLYVTNPLKRTNATISGNSPDDCVGTSC